MTQDPPLLKPLGLSCGVLHHNLSPSRSSQHTLVRSTRSPQQSELAPEGASYGCAEEDYVDLRSRSRSRGPPRDQRKKSKSSQSQYLAKPTSASSSPSGNELRSNEAVEFSTVSRPRKREDRRREDALAVSLSAGASSTANESRKATTGSYSSDSYWASQSMGANLEPLAAAGTQYYDTWKQQQRQERQDRIRGRVGGGT